MIKQKKDMTPYEAAYLEWSNRIGETKNQLRSWRIIALVSMLIALLLIFILAIVVAEQKTYVYVAEVRPNETTVNKIQLPQHFNANQAQEAYFVGKFINNITSLPLDPVVARQNWFDAYAMASGQALSQLTAFAQANDPLDNLGVETRSIQINSINPVSADSIQASWTTTTYNNEGVVQDQNTYNGVFTLIQGVKPNTTTGLLKNPFGLKITYFSINREG